jgi:hypothetical protein
MLVLICSKGLYSYKAFVLSLRSMKPGWHVQEPTEVLLLIYISCASGKLFSKAMNFVTLLLAAQESIMSLDWVLLPS